MIFSTIFGATFALISAVLVNRQLGNNNDSNVNETMNVKNNNNISNNSDSTREYFNLLLHNREHQVLPLPYASIISEIQKHRVHTDTTTTTFIDDDEPNDTPEDFTRRQMLLDMTEDELRQRVIDRYKQIENGSE
jgi:hypothetical protein